MSEPEDGFLAQVKAADDARLVAMVSQNYGPGRNSAIESELTRRLMVSLQASAKASDRAARWLIVLTVLLVLLTVILVALTIVLIVKS